MADTPSPQPQTDGLDTSPGARYTGRGGVLPDYAPGGAEPCRRA